MDIFSETDKKGQNKVVNILKDIFSSCTLNIEQHYEDKAYVDILMTATTVSGITQKYAIECKDRWYKSTSFNEWMLEEHKYNHLMNFKKQGYKPIYFNTFSDDKYMLWDVSKDEWEKRVFNCPNTTVIDSGRNDKIRFLLPSTACTYSGVTKTIDNYVVY